MSINPDDIIKEFSIEYQINSDQPKSGSLGMGLASRIIESTDQEVADVSEGLRRTSKTDYTSMDPYKFKLAGFGNEWTKIMAAMEDDVKENAPINYEDLERGEDEDVEGPAPRPPEYKTKPRLRGDAGVLSNYESAIKLQRESGDENFVDSVEKLAEKYNVTTNEIYAIIQGESKFDPTSVNNLGYKTMFQFGKDAITDINKFTDANVDYDTIEKLSPSEQVALYDKHLERWGYDGSVPLALMQAAPALANSMKGKPDSTIVYSKNSKSKKYRDAWNANPAWRTSKDGPITLGSLKAYYR